MESNSAKLCVILLSTGVGVGALLSHEAGQFFPWLPATAFVGLSIVAAILLFSREVPRHYAIGILLAISIFAVLYRCFIFISPASLVGIDPNLYATWTRAVITEGTTKAYQNRFYSRASASVLLPSLFGIISDLNSVSALIVYPVIAGVLVPLLSFVFYHRLAPIPTNRGALLTAILAIIAATSVRYSYNPIAQILSGLLLATLVIILVVRLQSGDGSIKHTLPVVFLLVTLTFTHKLSLFLVTGGFIFSFIFAAIYHYSSISIDTLPSWRSAAVLCTGVVITIGWGVVILILASPVFAVIGMFTAGILLYKLSTSTFVSHNQHSVRQMRLYSLLALVFLIVQWSIVSLFAERFIVDVVGGLLGFTSKSTVPNHQAAVRATNGLLNINGSWANALLPILLATLVIFFMALRSEGRDGIVVGMGFLAAPLALAPTSLVAASSTGINAARLFVGLHPLLFTFIVTGLVRGKRGRLWKTILTVVFVILIANQAFALQSTPDYPGASRQYLETDEVEAMEFAVLHTDTPIYTDRYATLNRIGLLHSPSQGWKYHYSQFKPITAGYADRTLPRDNQNYILQRSISVYFFDTPGYWDLTWNPERYLEQTQSKVYTTSETELFYNSSV